MARKVFFSMSMSLDGFNDGIESGLAKRPATGTCASRAGARRSCST